MWDAQTGEDLLIIGHKAGSVTFSPDGKRLASGDGDGMVKVWNVSDLTKRENAATKSTVSEGIRYRLPVGEIDELSKFIQDLKKHRPGTAAEDADRAVPITALLLRMTASR